MIPKIIHYCWFGGKPLPPLANKCIESWKKYMPNYSIIEWNESNFDVNSISYTKQAYELKKYAFVSDYARFFILYQHGGIYLDVDVELVKALDSIIDRDNIIMGMEQTGRVNPGLIIISPQKKEFLKKMIEFYKNEEFIISEMESKTIVTYTTERLNKKGLKKENIFQQLDDISIYPTEYFCPIDMKKNQLKLTGNTYSIHHFAASWISNWAKFKRKIRKLIGNKLYGFMYKIKHKSEKHSE